MDILHPLKSISAVGIPTPDSSITVLVHRTVPLDEERDFQDALKALLQDFDRFPGTLGSQVFRREQGANVEFSIVQRFARESDHEAWLQSPGFARWRHEVAPREPVPGHVRRYSGMAALFVTARAPAAPPRWKMAILLLLAVFPMSLAMSHWFAPALAKLSLAAGALITSIFMVVAMTYVLVPILTKLLERWLQPESSRSGRERAE